MKLAAIFLIFAALLLPEAAARKPKNPRRAKARAAAAARASKEAAPPKPKYEGLKEGRWRPDVRKALDEYILANGKWGESYDPQLPPVAALAFNEAAIEGDPGEAVFERVVTHADFKFDDAWWTLVPIIYGRQRLRVAYEQFQAEPVSVWSHSAAYKQYRKGFLRSYYQMCVSVTEMECRSWMATLFAGYGKEEAEALALEVIKEELGKPLGTDEITEYAGDPAPLPRRVGLKIVPEMNDLARVLIKNGFDVWVVDTEFKPALQAAAAELGVDESRVLGVEPEISTSTGRYLGRVKQPVPFRGGKVAALVGAVGRPASLVVGAGVADIELLSYGPGLRLLLDRGDAAVRARAEEREWLIQPVFAPASGL